MVDSAQIELLKARASREKEARKHAEALLEQKNLELFEANQELKVLAEHLEYIVKQRTEALQKATEEALRLATAKSQFLANVSHEFKTPLNGILGSLALLKSTRLDEEQSYMLDTAESSGENLVRLINDVLDVNNLSSNQVGLFNIPFSPKKVVQQAVANYKQEIAKKRLKLHLDIGDSLPIWLKGDPGRIRQIFEHLISNAVKFSETGTIAVTLDYNDTGFKFTISDQGIGISEAQKENIFDIFTKEDESFSRSYGGIGLGLTLCQKITTLMGGTINLRSVLHQGTEVRLLLPLAVETDHTLVEEEIEAMEMEEPMQIPPDTITFQGQQVLLVEDNLINQQVAKDLLERKNLQVTVVENGLEALNILESRTFDLILMDIQMPMMDGLEATRHIRASSGSHATIPVLVLTAHGLPQDIKKSMEAGANEHITKPFNTPELITQLAKYLDWQEGTPEKPQRETTGEQNELYGIDIASALDRLMNNPQLLEKVLLMFYHQYLPFGAKLLQSIRELNHEETRRALHTLKGSAGNVSAYKLAEHAAELEGDLKTSELCRKWSEKHQVTLTNTFKEMNKVLAGIKATYLADEANELANTLPTSPVDTESVTCAVEKIRDNIYVDLTEVEQQIMKLKEICQPSDLLSLVNELENAYQVFDYDIMEQRCDDLHASVTGKSQRTTNEQ